MRDKCLVWSVRIIEFALEPCNFIYTILKLFLPPQWPPSGSAGLCVVEAVTRGYWVAEDLMNAQMLRMT
jgi:hypothetical protein